MAPTVQRYDAGRDLASVTRMWREIRWLDDNDRKVDALATLLSAGNATVARIDGAAECLVHWSPGSMRYGEGAGATDLPLCAVTAVTTSPVARKQRLATRMTAAALADGAAKQHAVAMLGMFEQGFYDRLGFGTGSYEHRFRFDPRMLTVPAPAGRPVRVTQDDWVDVHECLRARTRRHGGVVLDPPRQTYADLVWVDDVPFGLGFRDGGGRLTHFFWGASGDAGLEIVLYGYETPEQLLELLGLLRTMADQVLAVTLLHEPPDLQLQDLLRRPVRHQARLREGRQPAAHEAHAWWQVRILDLAACIDAMHTSGPAVECNLVLHDPVGEVARAADGTTGPAWRGIGGEYVLRLGQSSTILPGSRSSLPTLAASVNAFSRLWLGVRPASSLALTDQLSGPDDLLARLDDAFRLPSPHPGLMF